MFYFNIYAEYNVDNFRSMWFNCEFRSLPAVYQVGNIQISGIKNSNVETPMNHSLW
jgi:hypothetical protein